MRMSFTNKIITCLVFSVIVLLAIVGHASALVSVSSPSSAISLCPASIFSVNISLSAVQNVYGFQFDMGYDSNIFEAVSITEGAFISANGQYDTYWMEPDLSTPGLIRNVVCSRLGEIGTSPSSGVLATANFRLKSGISYPATNDFVLSNVKLVDLNSGFLDSTKQDGEVAISNCTCADGDAASCTSTDGCPGISTCVNGNFGDCINSPPYYCDTNCDGVDECLADDCVECECTGTGSRNCETSGGCDGRTYCVSGNWTDCIITHYYCDFSCDGVNETCSDTPCPLTCTCIEDWDCEAWSTCSGGTQDRSCTDLNDCGTDDSMPSTSRTCSTGGGSTGGSSSGSSSGSSLPPLCTEEWACDSWSSCQPDGFSRRTCNDANACGSSAKKPKELEICYYEGSCDDWIMNQDETGIDCGGSCQNSCPEPELSENQVEDIPRLSIAMQPIRAEILDQHLLKIIIENLGQSEVNDLRIVANKWNTEPQYIQSLMPGMAEQRELALSLPSAFDETSVDIQVVKDDIVIAMQTVPVTLSVPLFSVKINKDIDTGRIYETVIVDNRGALQKTVDVDVIINKGKETYLLETGKAYVVGENQILNQVDYLYQDLPAGKYEVKSAFYENGQKIGEATSYVTLESNKKPLSLKYLFYFLLLGIVGVSCYVFFMSQKNKGEK